jgi:hypothetical protein
MRGALVITLLMLTGREVLAQGLEFAVARFASHSSHTLYAGYQVGPGLLFGGVLQNPRSAYREALFGVGRAFGQSGRAVTVGVAAATTSAGNYAQLYVLPSIGVGALSVDATITAQAAFAGGPAELYLSPATATAPVGSLLRVGATWAYAGTFGRSGEHALGPTVSAEIPGGALGVHVLRGLGDRPHEVWLTARVTP